MKMEIKSGANIVSETQLKIDREALKTVQEELRSNTTAIKGLRDLLTKLTTAVDKLTTKVSAQSEERNSCCIIM